MIKTDILIIGAGPTGLFTVFEAGLLKLKCHLIDALPQAGGQCSEIYPKKPIVAIAGGLGSFEPRKPLIHNITDFEDKGVAYIIKNPEIYRNKKVVIAGGGDSALDWSIFLADVAAEVTLVHRRNEFRGALDSVEKASRLAKLGKIKLITEAQVKRLFGDEQLEAVVVKHNNSEKGETYLEVDNFIPLFGLSPKLGPMANWGLDIEKNAIKVNNAKDYQTNIPGVFAIGDVNTYEGKLKLILSGFHEAAVMCQYAYQLINPGKRYVMKYTTVGGVEGFDGSKKEAKKEVVQRIALSRKVEGLDPMKP